MTPEQIEQHEVERELWKGNYGQIGSGNGCGIGFWTAIAIWLGLAAIIMAFGHI